MAEADRAVSTAPVSESATYTVPLGSESSTVIMPPEVAPSAVGAKVRPMTQDDFAARLPLMLAPECGQVVGEDPLVSTPKGPLNTADVMVRGLAWLFQSVTCWVGLVVLMATVPKARLVGLSLVVGTPAPERDTACESLLGVAVMLSVPPG